MDHSQPKYSFDQKKVTIHVTKAIRYWYRAEERRLVPVPLDFSEDHTTSVEMILQATHFQKQSFVEKLMQRFNPDRIAKRMQELVDQGIEKNFHKALDRAEYEIVRQAAASVIGSDDDPSRIYSYLGDLLKDASSEMEAKNQSFVQNLTLALKRRGLLPNHDHQ